MDHQTIIDLIGEIGDFLGYKVEYEKNEIDITFTDIKGEKIIFQVEDKEYTDKIISNNKKARDLRPKKFLHLFLRKAVIASSLPTDENYRVLILRNRLVNGVSDIKITKKSELRDLPLENFQIQELLKLHNFIKENAPFKSLYELQSKYKGIRSNRSCQKYFTALNKLGLIQIEMGKNNWTKKIIGVNPLAR